MPTFNDCDGFQIRFDDSITEDERTFYMKMYPVVDAVYERRVHCTVCNIHLGTAPSEENSIHMHPILRVTLCKKCLDFYSSGEFTKGEDGSELYCRWCGQGGEVYCCSKCSYVFCKNCISTNLSPGCVNDIEENENWNCFVCAPKIMWLLRAQHWALMNYIEKQKQTIQKGNYNENEAHLKLSKDNSVCCKPHRSKSGNASDSSIDSTGSVISKKRKLIQAFPKSARKLLPKTVGNIEKDLKELEPTAKKCKKNDEVVCTPDVLSMLQADDKPLQNSVSDQEQLRKQQQQRQLQIQQHHKLKTPQPKTNIVQIPNQPLPPPLILRSFNPSPCQPAMVTRKAVIGPRFSTSSLGQSPVYHTINGFRIDLNSASQQETFRLPNGKLIQVKKQGTTTTPVSQNTNSIITPSSSGVTISNQVLRVSGQIPIGNVQSVSNQTQGTVQHITIQQPSLATIRYAPATAQHLPSGTSITATMPNTPRAVINHIVNGTTANMSTNIKQNGPVLVRQFFESTPLGQVRSQLQSQVFVAMDLCQHLTGKIHTLTNSNAYKSVKNLTDVKELYIHLSYLFTYAIGRFKSIQEKCMEDMRKLGFGGDAASLESGQIAAEKYVSDDDDDDVEIVEPKTTLIDLDSDNDEATSPKTTSGIKRDTGKKEQQKNDSKFDVVPPNLLAGLLEVELHEGTELVKTPTTIENVAKKPRKKMTNKPNPHLIKQQQIHQREKELEKIRSDLKLNVECSVVLSRIDEVENISKGNNITLLSTKNNNEIDKQTDIPLDNKTEINATTQIDILGKLNDKENDNIFTTEELNKQDLNSEMLCDNIANSSDNNQLNEGNNLDQNINCNETNENENNPDKINIICPPESEINENQLTENALNPSSNQNTNENTTSVNEAEDQDNFEKVKKNLDKLDEINKDESEKNSLKQKNNKILEFDILKDTEDIDDSDDFFKELEKLDGKISTQEVIENLNDTLEEQKSNGGIIQDSKVICNKSITENIIETNDISSVDIVNNDNMVNITEVDIK